MPEEPANVNATSALPDDIRESVSVANVKTLGEAVAALTAGMIGAQFAHTNRVQTLAEAELANSMGFSRNATAQAIKAVAEMDLPEIISNLGAAIASGQQNQKGAGNTPPVTP